jgi:hypothetical protein
MQNAKHLFTIRNVNILKQSCTHIKPVLHLVNVYVQIFINMYLHKLRKYRKSAQLSARTTNIHQSRMRQYVALRARHAGIRQRGFKAVEHVNDWRNWPRQARVG